MEFLFPIPYKIIFPTILYYAVFHINAVEIVAKEARNDYS